jgi:hypothetical protein
MFGRISLQNLDTVSRQLRQLRHQLAQDELLHAMLTQPGLSMAELAKHLHWPNKVKVQRVMQELSEAKFVKRRGRTGHYELTVRGESEATEIAQTTRPTLMELRIV